MKKGLVILLASIFVISMLFASVGCKTTTTEETTAAQTTVAETTAAETTAAETTAPTEKIKMAIGTVNLKTDESWGTSMYETAEYIKANYPDVEVMFTDAVPFGDFAKWLTLQAENGAQLFFLDSNATWQQALMEVAPNFPDVWFVTGGGGMEINATLPENVTVYMVSQEEGEYLAGVTAGLTTESDKIGFVSAFDYPAIVANWKAWELGAKSVNPDLECIVSYTGAWGDAEKHYETCRSVLEQGADILNHDLDSLGFLKAAQEKEAWLIGAHVDQSHLDPGLFLTSALIMHDIMGEVALQKFMDGTISKEGAKYGLKDGYDTLVPLTNVSDEVKAQVDEIKEKIRSGEIVVPLIWTDEEE